MAANAIVKITKRAKQLQKHNPNRKWSTLIQEASREYRAGHLGKVPKTKAAKKGKGRRVHGAGTGIDNQAVGRVGRGIDNPMVGRASMRGVGTGIDNPAVGRIAHNGASISQLKKGMRDQLNNKLATLTVRQFAAKGVREKRKIGKEIAAVKKDLRKYC